MTIHAAKGLEFSTVFLLGMNEEILPSFYSSAGKALEEERRLAYVALTRAKDHLIITHSRQHNTGSPQSQSRFLREIQGAPIIWENKPVSDFAAWNLSRI